MDLGNASLFDVCKKKIKNVICSITDLGKNRIPEHRIFRSPRDGQLHVFYTKGMDLYAPTITGSSPPPLCLSLRRTKPLFILLSLPAQARQLLKEASEGLNPFEGFTPRLADGESLVFGSEEFESMEAKGLEAAAKTGFVLVSAWVGFVERDRVFLLAMASCCCWLMMML